MLARFLLAALALAVLPAAAETLLGKVVHISDGDTLTLLMERKQVVVRLSEIDAPELKQAFGQRARASLGALCAEHAAVVRASGTDRYGRVLGRVECGGVDANAEQVRRGMAWVFDRYVTDRGLYALQDQARGARLGLWSDVSPVAPWDWRAQHRR
jgi:endonuclease YncB( thermonuclease family)